MIKASSRLMHQCLTRAAEAGKHSTGVGEDMEEGRGWAAILAILCVAELAGSLETTLVFAAMPGALRQYGDPSAVAWLITGYFLVAGAASAICGRLGDLFGRSKVLIAVLAAACAGSVLSAASTDLIGIIVGRAVQGVAGAVLPLSYGLVREHLPATRLSIGLAAITAVASLGAAGGFLIGGLIVDHWDWQQIFTASAVLSAAAAVLCHTRLPRSVSHKPDSKGLDLAGGALFAPAIGMILIAVSRASAAKPGGFELSMLVAGSGLLALWIRHELRQENPLIDIRLLASKPVALANCNALLVSMGAFQVMQIFPVLIQQPAWTGIGFGLTATMTGLLKLPSNVASAMGAVLAGKLAGRRGGVGAVVVGTTLTLIAWFGLAVGSASLWVVVVMVCLSSAGVVISLTGTVAVIVRHSPASRTSEATGMTMVLRMTFQGIGAQIVASIFMNGWISAGQGSTYMSPDAVIASIGYVAFVCVFAVFNALWLRSALSSTAVEARAEP